MQPGDRGRIFRSLGLGLGSLLLLSGAVFASQSGNRADDRPQAAASGGQEASESAEPSHAPGIDAFQGGEVKDASESPEASPEDASESPEASPEDELSDEHGNPGSAGDVERSGPSGGDDDSGHDDSGPGQGGEDD